MEQTKSPYSADGYIVDQARLKEIRYGVFTSDINGCGWIAVFNFLKQQGRAESGETLAGELIRYTVFRGLLGTDLFRVRRFLKRRGFPTRLWPYGNKTARLPEETRAGVIYYCHKDGFHFVTFYYDDAIQLPGADEPRYRFLNGIAAKQDHYDTMRGFLTKHNVVPLALILTWPKPARR